MKPLGGSGEQIPQHCWSGENHHSPLGGAEFHQVFKKEGKLKLLWEEAWEDNRAWVLEKGPLVAVPASNKFQGIWTAATWRKDNQEPCPHHKGLPC